MADNSICLYYKIFRMSAATSPSGIEIRNSGIVGGGNIQPNDLAIPGSSTAPVFGAVNVAIIQL